MNQHGQVQACTGLPDRIEHRIVDVQARSIGLSRAEAEVLHDLTDSQRPVLRVGFELLHDPLGEARVDVVEVDVREHRHPVLVWRVPDRGDALNQSIAGRTGRVDQDPQIQRIHALHDGLELFGTDRCRLVAVDVDNRKLRPRHRMLGHDECRFRLVVDDARRGELGLAVGTWPVAQRARTLRALRHAGDHGRCQQQRDERKPVRHPGIVPGVELKRRNQP